MATGHLSVLLSPGVMQKSLSELRKVRMGAWGPVSPVPYVCGPVSMCLDEHVMASLQEGTCFCGGELGGEEDSCEPRLTPDPAKNGLFLYVIPGGQDSGQRRIRSKPNSP